MDEQDIIDDILIKQVDPLSSEDIEDCLYTVFHEMTEEGLVILQDERFQMAVLPYDVGLGEGVWSYFPAHRRRRIAKHVVLKPPTRVVLVICEPGVESRPHEKTEGELRHHLGHAILYLHDPKSPNTCADAVNEWYRWSKWRRCPHCQDACK